MHKLQKFAELGLSDEILVALSRKGFEEPSPIQAKCIPTVFSSEKDIIGQAQTGTGKTAAFGLPIIDLIDSHQPHVQTVVLAPTRELAIQVAEEMHSFIGAKDIKIAPVYGGQSISLQLKSLRRGVDIVVGTPGRIIDHLDRGSLDISKIKYFVLDEADEMLNMGFIEDIEKILEYANKERRTLLFSATMPPRIKKLAENYMNDYEMISVKNRQLTADLTDQIYFEVRRQDKLEALCRIIDIEEEFYSIIFCHTRNDVNTLTNKLLERGYDTDCLHGEISQAQRERTLQRFKNKNVNILVATDVAARGIDVNDLTHVINYSLPQNTDTYVHRIGRTGRAGKKGKAITFVTPFEYQRLFRIQQATNTKIKKEIIPAAEDIVNTKKSRLIDEINLIIDAKSNSDFFEFANALLKEQSPTELVAALLKQFVQKEWDPANYPEIKDASVDRQGKSRLFIAKGKTDDLTPRKLVDMIRDKVKVPERKMRDIRIFESFSFVTVPFIDAEMIIEAFASDKRRKPLVERAKDKGGSNDRGRRSDRRPDRGGRRSDGRRSDGRRSDGRRFGSGRSSERRNDRNRRDDNNSRDDRRRRDNTKKDNS